MLHSSRLRSIRRVAVVVIACLAAVLALSVGVGSHEASAAPRAQLVADSAHLASTSPTIPARVDCSAIASVRWLAALHHYPTSIASATDVPAADGNPAYCDVKGMIAPQTHFEMKLPETTWQGRYLQNGCGGYCGAVQPQQFPSCDAELGGDFAMATDDEGHVSSGGLGGAGLFAFNDQELREQYGYKSEQALYVVAKKIITYYYGTPPHYSYYDGCSDGGREAMEMAERYPADFDGIIAGAPEIIAGPLNAEQQTWLYRVNVGPDGNAILTSNKLPALAAAVIKECGHDDGVNDGIITDPRDCHFDPASIQCPRGTDSTSCLTPAQVDVVRKIYQGPVDEHGRHLYPGGLPYGSESGWNVFAVPRTPADGGPVPATAALAYFGLSLPYLRYQLLRPGKLGPDPSEWKFTDRYFHKMFPVADTWDAMDTNLSAFRRHGGKLIMWQGWADNGIPPFGTVDYYQTLSRRMGGLHRTQQFARLFMFPTVFHCGGGYADSSFDLVLPMVNWVEHGTAPTKVIATDTIDNNTLQRPVYPYPLIPKYDGHGPTDSAASFHPVVSPAANEYTHWIGDYLFYKPISRR